MNMKREHLLILEDEPAIRASYEILLDEKYRITFANNCQELRALWKPETYDCVLLDIQLPDGNGLDLLKILRKESPEQDIIMSSALNDSQTIVEAIRRGASDYITKPIDKNLLDRVLEKLEKTRRLQWERKILLEKVKDSQERFSGIVGISLAMRHICETIRKLKGRSSSILLMGESGVGKEVIARAIHANENNALRPFVPVNCAAIPENLLESELFGHEKGAFTGASQSRLGKFVQAHNGDIFLDEIACMSPNLQAKLLRVLQDKIVEPLGGTKQIRSNFRVIAATNQDIPAMIEKGEFRRDLYFRLQGVEIFIPPLRARTEDIPLLIENILKEEAHKFGRRHFTEEALNLMSQYDWPGNVRELKNTVENILILTPNETIGAEHLPPTLKMPKTSGNRSMAALLKSNIRTYERDVIVAALKRYHGNKSRASKELGISRSILYRKMKALDVGEGDVY